MTFNEFCKEYNLTYEEIEKCATYLIAMRIRKIVDINIKINFKDKNKSS